MRILKNIWRLRVKIKRITLKNFRQFYDEQTIHISTDKDKSVTIIHGENGFGKTTLLNAIYWCLYGELIADDGYDIVSKEAKNEHKYKSFVELEVIVPVTLNGVEEERTYTVKRTFDYLSKAITINVLQIVNDNYVNLAYVEDDYQGKKKIDNPTVLINKWLPKTMGRYFIFEGENGIAGTDDIKIQKPEDFQNAVRTILGFTYAETALMDLKSFKIKLDREENDALSSNLALQNAHKEKMECQENLSKEKDSLATYKETISTLEAEKEQISKQIENSGDKELRALEREHISLENHKKTLDEDYKKLNIDKQGLIQKYGAVIFGLETVSSVRKYITEAKKVGLPAPYDDKLISDLEKQGKCICGRDLIPGTPEYDLVQSLRNSANTGEIQNRTSKVEFLPQYTENKAKEFLSELEAIINRFAVNQKTLSKVEAKLEENKIKQQEASKTVVDITELNDERREIDRNLKPLKTQLVLMEIQISNYEKGVQRSARLLASGNVNNERLEEVNKKQSLLELLINSAESQLLALEKEGRDNIQKSVGLFLSKYFNKNYTFYLSSDYSYHLREDGVITKLSTGELQLLNLAFISALIKQAAARSGESSGLTLAGAIAPFTIDAPFGQLDSSYKTAVAEELRLNSEQLILLLSTSQWEGVNQVLNPYIGREILLVNHQKMPENDAQIKTEKYINIGGVDHQMSYFNSDKSFTKIKQVI